MPSRKNVRPSFVVVIHHNEFSTEVLGPYRSFKHADGDARAMGGTCHPLTRVNLQTGELTSVENGGFVRQQQ